jgi:hypothetical protein
VGDGVYYEDSEPFFLLFSVRLHWRLCPDTSYSDRLAPFGTELLPLLPFLFCFVFRYVYLFYCFVIRFVFRFIFYFDFPSCTIKLSRALIRFAFRIRGFCVLQVFCEPAPTYDPIEPQPKKKNTRVNGKTLYFL